MGGASLALYVLHVQQMKSVNWALACSYCLLYMLFAAAKCPYTRRNSPIGTHIASLTHPERKDGQRNPLCDKPQGQKQLQNLALSLRPLAWAWAYNQDQVALTAAERLLKIFFLDEETRMMPETLYAQVNLGAKPLKGDKLFVVAVSDRLFWEACELF
jgi:hypothetical protein